jgi:RND family efflux transporter MFP subunit
LVFLLISACRAAEPPRYAFDPPKVEVAKLGADEITETVQLHGQLTVPPGRLTELSSLESGYLSRYLVHEGEAVRAEQVLAEIAAGPSQAQLEGERARLAQAQARAVEVSARAERTNALLAQGAASSREQQTVTAEAKVADAAVHEAQASVAAAERHLARSTLRAPFDGRVLRLLGTVGEAVSGGGQPLLEMADLSVLELAASATAEQAGQLAVDQTAAVRFDVLPAQTFPGIVASLSPALDPMSGVARVRVRLTDGGSDAGLLLGMWGVADVHGSQRHTGLKLPRSALLLNEGEPLARVLVLGVDGKHVQSRSVHLGLGNADTVEVTEGLAPGDVVVVRGGYGLPDGSQVIVEAPK